MTARHDKATAARHGNPQGEVPVDVFLSDDPDLAMVNADMGAWVKVHGCPGEDGPCACVEDEDCLPYSETRHLPLCVGFPDQPCATLLRRMGAMDWRVGRNCGHHCPHRTPA